MCVDHNMCFYVKKKLFQTVFFIIIIIIKTSYIHQGQVKNTPELYIILFGCNSLLLFNFIYLTLFISLLFQDRLRWFMSDVWSLNTIDYNKIGVWHLYLCLMLMFTYIQYYIPTHMTHTYVVYIITTVCIIIVEIKHLLSTAAARLGEPSTLGGLSNARMS